MIRNKTAFFALGTAAAIAAAGLSARAATRGDPENGAKLAERWCAACHVVSPQQQRASADAPPFSAIGQGPDFSAEALAFFLMEPHPKMPSMSLTRQEAADLAAYITTVSRQPR